MSWPVKFIPSVAETRLVPATYKVSLKFEPLCDAVYGSDEIVVLLADATEAIISDTEIVKSHIDKECLFFPGDIIVSFLLNQCPGNYKV
jgi:hypothetical protein